jgi:bifunctional non-homologous end joining protein LigD
MRVKRPHLQIFPAIENFSHYTSIILSINLKLPGLTYFIIINFDRPGAASTSRGLFTAHEAVTTNSLKAQSFLIDGEAVIARDDGTPDFRALRSKRRGQEAGLYAFDLIEHDGDDLRDVPLIERKFRLFKLIRTAKRRSIRFVEHLTGDGSTVFDHVCRMGLEGIVSKRTDAPYRSGPSEDVAQVEEPGERGGASGAPGERHQVT